MKTKVLIALCFLTSLIGYLEWGSDQSMFLFQSEWDILQKLFTDPKSVIHPFILLPLFGQVLLLISLFPSNPNKLLVYAGLAGIGVLLVFMFVAGLLSLNLKITISTLPFIIFGIMVLRTINLNKKG